MLVPLRWIVMMSNLMILWMIISTFVTSSFGFALVLAALSIGGIQYVRIAPVHYSKIGESIESLFKVDKKNHLKSTIFHKAGGFHAPENTLEAIKKAVSLGVPAVEIDLEITSEGVGVVHHGPTVDSNTDGVGRISQLTHDYIKTLSVTIKEQHKDKYPVARIPTIDECLKLCVDNGLVVFIDCKSDAARTAKIVTELYQKYPELYGLGIVCSFYPSVIYAVRQIDSNIVTAVTFRELYMTLAHEDGGERNKELWKRVLAPIADFLLGWAHRYIIWFVCGNSFFLCNKNHICWDSKAFFEKMGVRMVAWTVNDSLEKRFLLDHLKVPVITDGLDMPSTSG